MERDDPEAIFCNVECQRSYYDDIGALARRKKGKKKPHVVHKKPVPKGTTYSVTHNGKKTTTTLAPGTSNYGDGGKSTTIPW